MIGRTNTILQGGSVDEESLFTGIQKYVNSDCANEPLNFIFYINDIGIFGSGSFVMDKENESLWRQLTSQSLTLYGHEKIHDCVYERLTDEDVDYILRNNTRLAQSFNSFYKTSDYGNGTIDDVLKVITSNYYNGLEMKFQRGINRYINEHTADANAGKWLASIFGISALAEKTTMESILSDTTLWNDTILPNEPLRVVVCNSLSSIYYAADDSISTDVFNQFIETVATSTTATTDLIEQLSGNEKLTTFFENETVCDTIASSKSAMEAIVYSIDGFSAMASSTVAMGKVANNQTAVDVIIEGFENAANSDAVLTGIKENLESIVTSLPNIASSENVIEEVKNTKEAVNTCVDELSKINNLSDILISNIGSLVNSDTAMTAITTSPTCIKSIVKATPNAQIGSLYKAINDNETYVNNMKQIIGNTEYFEYVSGSNFVSNSENTLTKELSVEYPAICLFDVGMTGSPGSYRTEYSATYGGATALKLNNDAKKLTYNVVSDPSIARYVIGLPATISIYSYTTGAKCIYGLYKLVE